MADRSIAVRITANIASYQAAMAKATKDAKDFKSGVTDMAKSGDQGFQTISRGAGIAGLAIAVGFGKMIATASSFEKEMSGVQAVSGASAEQMDRLSEAAIAAGASTQLAGVTASDAAKAEAELVKAGVSVSDVLGGALMGSLQLASAGQIDFAKAAEIAAQSMNIFEMSGSQVGHVADVLAAAANKSAADVGQLGDAMRQGGLVAAQTGLSFEETVGALAAFSDNALLGSDAGTSLKSMLQRLTPVSNEAQGLMDELGFSAYDLQGNFIGLEGLAGELQDSLGGMTVQQRNMAMATLFGSDAVRAANILYEQGAEGVSEYVEAVNDQGAAARMAAIQNDNLAGDVEALGGAFESAFIENGSKATGALRGLTQTATSAVNGFSSMPSIVQSTAIGLTAVAGAGGLALGAIGTLAPKLHEARGALDKMGSSGQALNRNLGKIAGGMAVLGAGMAVWGAWETMMAGARREAQEWSDIWRSSALSSATDGLDAFKDKLAVVRQEQEGLNDAASSSKAPWDADYRASLRSGADELDNIGGEMERIASLADDMADKFNLSGDAALQFVLDQQSAGIDILASDYEAVSDALGDTFRSMSTGTVASQQLGESMETLGSDVASVEEQVDAFRKSLDVLYGVMFGVEDAQDALQSTLNEFPELLKNAKEEGLDLNDALTSQSDAAIGVREHMRGVMSAASDVIAEWRSQGVQGDELNARIRFLSGSLREQAIAAGMPIPVVDRYLAMLGRIPGQKNTNIHATLLGDMDAEQRINFLSRDRRARVYVDTIGGASTVARSAVRHGNVFAYASGGITPAHIAGPSTIYKYAEPETGGEAFVPKNGNRERSLSILSTAAAWHGASVVPMASGGIGRGAIPAGPGGAAIDYDRLAQIITRQTGGAGMNFNGPVSFGDRDIIPALDFYARTKAAGI